MSKLESTNLENSKSKDSGSKDSGSKNSGDEKSANNNAKLDTSKIEVISSSLEYPEGPIHCHDGSIILVEIKGQRLSKIAPCGTATTIAQLPGGPNGAAVGPNGCVYICNDGGFEWMPIPGVNKDKIIWVGGNQPTGDAYKGGSLQKIDTSSGEVTTLFTECTERGYPDPSGAAYPAWNPAVDLKGPDDLVFDQAGGIWFSDFGKTRERDRDITGLYYVSPDQKTITQMAYPLNSPNGIALSPDGTRLYFALTYERKVMYFELSGAGKIKRNPASLDGAYLLTAQLEGQAILDSMAVDVEGNLYLATMLPQGNTPVVNGGISIISPDGAVEYQEIAIPDGSIAPLPSNICFGGEDMKTAFVTCGGAGYLLKMPSAIAGLRLNHNGSDFKPPVTVS
jgi:gluconolactonase